MSSSLTDPLLPKGPDRPLETPPLVIDAFIPAEETPSPPTSAGSLLNGTCAQRSSRGTQANEREDEEQQREDEEQQRQDEEEERRPNRTHNIPRRHWRDGLCDCFNSCGVCVASWCCGTVAIGQVMTRMRLGLDGRPHAEPRGRSCKILVGATVVATSLNLIHHGANIISTLFGFYIVFLLFRVTRHVQKRYDLPGNLCDTLLQAFCCPCCLTARLVRHTADHGKYPYHLCSDRGLSRHAPGHSLTDGEEERDHDSDLSASPNDGDVV